MSETVEKTEAADDALYCPACGYDLRGIASDRCPECGATIHRASLRESSLPWARRQQVGAWRAYRRTVWTATWRVRRVADGVARPVDARDARHFATLTGLIAGVPPALGMILLIWS